MGDSIKKYLDLAQEEFSQGIEKGQQNDQDWSSIFSTYEQMNNFIHQLKNANIVIPDFIKLTAELSPQQFYNLNQELKDKGLNDPYYGIGESKEIYNITIKVVR